MTLPKPGLRQKKQVSRKHSEACRKYKEWFLSTYGYAYCERCGEKYPIAWDTHHIISASSAPQHPKLHDFRNLILLGRKCHDLVEQHPEKNRKLIIRRKLWELFSTIQSRRAQDESERRSEKQEESTVRPLLPLGKEQSDQEVV